MAIGQDDELESAVVMIVMATVPSGHKQHSVLQSRGTSSTPAPGFQSPRRPIYSLVGDAGVASTGVWFAGGGGVTSAGFSLVGDAGVASTGVSYVTGSS
jgi:hypothetical protein